MSWIRDTRWVNSAPSVNTEFPQGGGRRICTAQTQRHFSGKLGFLSFDANEKRRDSYDAGFEPRKKILASSAPNSCLFSQLRGSAAIIRDDANRRPPSSKRRSAAPPPDLLEPGFHPSTCYDPRISKKFISHTEPDTYRVLNTDNEPVQRRGGLRCDRRPEDELSGSFAGRVDPKVDRGLRCHFDVPQTLSFRM